jgi:hypothetical protein
MPGFTTHYIFGDETVAKVSELQVKQLLSKYAPCYHLGLQGPDIFFYYLPAYFITERNVGNLMHDTSTLAFFEALLEARNRLRLPKARAIADAYIYGFIGHYSLDTVCHPYIYSRSHHIRNKDNKTYDFGCHVSLETDIDRTLLWHFHRLKPSAFAPGDTIRLDGYALHTIGELVSRAIKNTYPDYKVSPFRVRQAARFMRYENNWMHDPSGTKKFLIRTIEQKILGHGFISTMVPSDSFTKYTDCCNLRHKKWSNPWNPSVSFTSDFYALMEDATEDFLRRIDLYQQCVAVKKKRSKEERFAAENALLADLGDCSYLSGFPL